MSNYIDKLSPARQFKKEIASQIKKARKEKGISKIDLAKKVRTSRSQIDRLEDPAQCNPTLGTLLRVSKYLDKELSIKFIKRRLIR